MVRCARTTPAVRASLEARVRRIVAGIAAAYGATATVELARGYPPVINNDALAQGFTEYLRSNGDAKVERQAPTMGGEDFAYFAQRVPGLLVRLGVRSDEEGAVHPIHSPLFRLDERALRYGVETLVAFARYFLST